MHIRLEQIKEAAKTRPEGYEQDVLSNGRIEGEFLSISPASYTALRVKYSPNKPEAKRSCCGGGGNFPPVKTQIGNATRAVGRILDAVTHGRPVTIDNDTITKRIEICNACEHHSNGRCKLCGCVLQWKRTLATEKCPDKPPRW